MWDADLFNFLCWHEMKRNICTTDHKREMIELNYSLECHGVDYRD